jgi:hypothetical protein
VRRGLPETGQRAENHAFLQKGVAIVCKMVYNYSRQNKIGVKNEPIATKERI